MAVVVPAHHEELEVVPELPVPRPPDAQQRGFLATLDALLSVMEGESNMLDKYLVV